MPLNSSAPLPKNGLSTSHLAKATQDVTLDDFSDQKDALNFKKGTYTQHSSGDACLFF